MTAGAEVLTGVAEVLRSVAGVEPSEATPDARFADLGIDSMTMVEVIVGLEDRFGLLVDDEEWAGFRTVGDLTGHIERAVAGHG